MKKALSVCEKYYPEEGTRVIDCKLALAEMYYCWRAAGREKVEKACSYFREPFEVLRKKPERQRHKPVERIAAMYSHSLTELGATKDGEEIARQSGLFFKQFCIEDDPGFIKRLRIESSQDNTLQKYRRRVSGLELIRNTLDREKFVVTCVGTEDSVKAAFELLREFVTTNRARYEQPL